MTMDEYLKWLDNRIAVVGTELEQLINARKTIEMARGEVEVNRIPKDIPHAPRLTLREAEAKVKVNRHPDRWKSALEEVMTMIRVAPEPMTSGEIIYKLYPEGATVKPTKRDKDRIYTALSYLKTKGDLKRSAQGYWSLSAALTEGGKS